MNNVKLPSGRIVNLDKFVTMAPDDIDHQVRFTDGGIIILNAADAEALYRRLERDSEWLTAVKK